MINSTTGMVVGGGLVTLGIVIILFSPYRRWLAFMLAGMVFWSFLEVMRVSTQYLFSFNDFQGYMTGIGVALGVLASWLAATEKKAQSIPVLYIEHTPVYDDEVTHST